MLKSLRTFTQYEFEKFNDAENFAVFRNFIKVGKLCTYALKVLAILLISVKYIKIVLPNFKMNDRNFP